jgi:hypothetical protein
MRKKEAERRRREGGSSQSEASSEESSDDEQGDGIFASKSVITTEGSMTSSIGIPDKKSGGGSNFFARMAGGKKADRCAEKAQKAAQEEEELEPEEASVFENLKIWRMIPRDQVRSFKFLCFKSINNQKEVFGSSRWSDCRMNAQRDAMVSIIAPQNGCASTRTIGRHGSITLTVVSSTISLSTRKC